MNKRFLSAFLVLATGLITLCGVSSPVHACCQKTSEQLSATLPDCCMWQAAAQPQPQLGTNGNGSGADTWVSSANTHFSAEYWMPSQQSTMLSRLANCHRPDQSNLHQELSVWLN